MNQKYCEKCDRFFPRNHYMEFCNSKYQKEFEEKFKMLMVDVFQIVNIPMFLKKNHHQMIVTLC